MYEYSENQRYPARMREKSPILIWIAPESKYMVQLIKGRVVRASKELITHGLASFILTMSKWFYQPPNYWTGGPLLEALVSLVGCLVEFSSWGIEALSSTISTSKAFFWEINHAKNAPKITWFNLHPQPKGPHFSPVTKWHSVGSQVSQLWYGHSWKRFCWVFV